MVGTINKLKGLFYEIGLEEVNSRFELIEDEEEGMWLLFIDVRRVCIRSEESDLARGRRYN